jgi:hypothetical protein
MARPHATFDDAAEFCGRLDRPGRGLTNVAEVDYSRRETTPDQLRIMDVLAVRDLSGCVLLHVGVGNSALARRLSCRVRRIDGLTIHANEKANADALGLPNYVVYLLNKHSKDLACLNADYDFIIDNNLGSFCCCRYHFYMMLDNYVSHLRPRGQVLTDQRGLTWTVDGNREWKLTWDDMVVLGATFPIRAERVSDSVYALTRLG